SMGGPVGRGSACAGSRPRRSSRRKAIAVCRGERRASGDVRDVDCGRATHRDQETQVLPAHRHCPRGNDGHLDQSRRRCAYRRFHDRAVPIARSRHRRVVLVSVHQDRHLSVLLHAASADDREGHRQVTTPQRHERGAPMKDAMDETEEPRREDTEPGHGIDRRGFLHCMAWAGTGLVWAAAGGVFSSRTLGPTAAGAETASGGFSFVQISDTHIGFKGDANKDVMATFEVAVARIKALEPRPAFVIHTGDITHTQKPGAFDVVTEALKGTGTERVFYVPGENDVFADGGKEYLGRFAAGGPGWQSFDYRGVHFIGLINVLNFKAGGLGALGVDQIEWLENDVAPLGSSTPIVLFAHVPLWAVYPKWGWVTEDAGRALGYLKR